MNPSSVAKFFPRMIGATRAWFNISAPHSAIDVWLSGALTLKRSVDIASILTMASHYELKLEVLAGQAESLKYPGRLFVWNATDRPNGEIIRSAFLARDGKLCAIELSSSTTLEKLLEATFQDYLQSVQAKMSKWSPRSAEQRATVEK
jgi:hypothetical protein